MEYRSEKERKFEIVYRSYADDVYRACLYLTKDQKVAQDIAEQVFIEFYDSWIITDQRTIRYEVYRRKN